MIEWPNIIFSTPHCWWYDNNPSFTVSQLPLFLFYWKRKKSCYVARLSALFFLSFLFLQTFQKQGGRIADKLIKEIVSWNIYLFGVAIYLFGVKTAGKNQLGRNLGKTIVWQPKCSANEFLNAQLFPIHLCHCALFSFKVWCHLMIWA